MTSVRPDCLTASAAPGTAGKPPRGTEIRLYDEQGQEVPQGEVGRIFVGNEMSFEGYTGGVFVGTADLDGDGDDEILVSADAGAAPHVKAFGTSDEALLSFLAYDESFRGGVRINGQDRDGDGDDEIVTGTGPGVRGHVKVFDGDGSLIDSLFVTEADDLGGIHV